MRSAIAGLSVTFSLVAAIYALPAVAAPPQPECKPQRCSTWNCSGSGSEARSCQIFLTKGGKCVLAKFTTDSRPAIRCAAKPKTLPKAPTKALK